MAVLLVPLCLVPRLRGEVTVVKYSERYAKAEVE